MESRPLSLLTVLRRAFPVKLYAWQAAEKPAVKARRRRRRNGKYTVNGSRGYSSLMLAAKYPLLYPFPFFFLYSFPLSSNFFPSTNFPLLWDLSSFISFRRGIIENYFRPFHIIIRCLNIFSFFLFIFVLQLFLSCQGIFYIILSLSYPLIFRLINILWVFDPIFCIQFFENKILFRIIGD